MSNIENLNSILNLISTTYAFYSASHTTAKNFVKLRDAIKLKESIFLINRKIISMNNLDHYGNMIYFKTLKEDIENFNLPKFPTHVFLLNKTIDKFEKLKNENANFVRIEIDKNENVNIKNDIKFLKKVIFLLKMYIDKNAENYNKEFYEEVDKNHQKNIVGYGGGIRFDLHGNKFLEEFEGVVEI